VKVTYLLVPLGSTQDTLQIHISLTVSLICRDFTFSFATLELCFFTIITAFNLLGKTLPDSWHWIILLLQSDWSVSPWSHPASKWAIAQYHEPSELLLFPQCRRTFLSPASLRQDAGTTRRQVQIWVLFPGYPSCPRHRQQAEPTHGASEADRSSRHDANPACSCAECREIMVRIQEHHRSCSPRKQPWSAC